MKITSNNQTSKNYRYFYMCKTNTQEEIQGPYFVVLNSLSCKKKINELNKYLLKVLFSN